MPTFATKPSPFYYMNILQHDDGTYTADQKPLDDWTTEKMDLRQPGMITVVMTGLRSNVRDLMINPTTSSYIYKFAPDWKQRNATQAIQTLSAKTPPLSPSDQTALDNAKALWTWVNACVTYSNTLAANVRAMTFEQILIYVVPTTGWPDPPASLVPAPTGQTPI